MYSTRVSFTHFAVQVYASNDHTLQLPSWQLYLFITDTHRYLNVSRVADHTLSSGHSSPLITDSVGSQWAWIVGDCGAVEKARAREVGQLYQDGGVK